jgi:hypothetical protein
MTGTDNTDQTPPPAPEETQVEIHKPKPVHNWREFLGEIAVVVVGVLIALSAEQVVEGIARGKIVARSQGSNSGRAGA